MNNNKKVPWEGRAFLSDNDLEDMSAVSGSIEVFTYDNAGRPSIDINLGIALDDKVINVWMSDGADDTLRKQLTKIEKLRDFLSLFLRESKEVLDREFPEADTEES